MDTIRTRRHQKLVKILIEERKRAGITQVQLAKEFKRSQTWVARMENGRRRIDVIEFLDLAKTIGFNPARIISQLAGNTEM